MNIEQTEQPFFLGASSEERANYLRGTHKETRNRLHPPQEKQQKTVQQNRLLQPKEKGFWLPLFGTVFGYLVLFPLYQLVYLPFRVAWIAWFEGPIKQELNEEFSFKEMFLGLFVFGPLFAPLIMLFANMLGGGRHLAPAWLINMRFRLADLPRAFRFIYQIFCIVLFPIPNKHFVAYYEATPGYMGARVKGDGVLLGTLKTVLYFTLMTLHFAVLAVAGFVIITMLLAIHQEGILNMPYMEVFEEPLQSVYRAINR